MKNKTERKIRFGGYNNRSYKQVRRALERRWKEDYGLLPTPRRKEKRPR